VLATYDGVGHPVPKPSVLLIPTGSEKASMLNMRDSVKLLVQIIASCPAVCSKTVYDPRFAPGDLAIDQWIAITVCTIWILPSQRHPSCNFYQGIVAQKWDQGWKSSNSLFEEIPSLLTSLNIPAKDTWIYFCRIALKFMPKMAKLAPSEKRFEKGGA